MSTIELDRLKAFVGFAEQVCSHSGNGDDARRHINHLISRAEEDIKTKNLEIQMQQSHISLLKHLDGFMTRPIDTSVQVRLGETGAAPGPRAIVADAK